MCRSKWNCGGSSYKQKDDKKRHLADEKLTMRRLALQETTEVNGIYLKSGRQINIDETRRTVEHAETLIQRNIVAFARRQK